MTPSQPSLFDEGFEVSAQPVPWPIRLGHAVITEKPTNKIPFRSLNSSVDISLLTPESVAVNTPLEGCEHVRDAACCDTGRLPDTLFSETPRTRQQEPTQRPVSGSGSPFSPQKI